MNRIPLLTLISIGSMLMSMAVQVVTAIRLGVGAERDALFVAMSVPLFINLLLVSTVGVVITPVVLRHRIMAARRQMGMKVFAGLTVATVLLAALVHAFNTSFVHVLAPGFDVLRHTLTVELLSLAVVMLPVQAASSVLGGYLMAQERILVPNLSLAAGNAVTLAALCLVGQALNAWDVVVATLAGALLVLVVQLLALRRAEVTPLANTDRQDGSAPAGLYKQAMPLVISGLVSRSMPFVERNLASGMGMGTISCLGYASYMISFLVNATTAPTATAYFARMCNLWNEGKREEVGMILEKNLLWVVSVALTGAGLFILASAEVFAALPTGNRLTNLDVVEFVAYGQILMVAFVFLACGGLLSRLFYVAGASMQMAFLDCLATGCYVVAAYFLAQGFAGRGLAVSVSLHAVIVTGLFIVWARRQFKTHLRGVFFRRLAGISAKWSVVFAGAVALKHIAVPGLNALTGALATGFIYIIAVAWVLRRTWSLSDIYASNRD